MQKERPVEHIVCPFGRTQVTESSITQCLHSTLSAMIHNLIFFGSMPSDLPRQLAPLAEQLKFCQLECINERWCINYNVKHYTLEK